jgi:nucleoside-diphosphate-sugar epimerase
VSSGNKRVFVAGASGAIGRPLCRLLVADGWSVIAATRSPEKAQALRELGATPVVVDVFDEPGLREVMVASGASAVVHQLTDLPAGLDPAKMREGRARTARIRRVGTRHLLLGAIAAGAGRVVAQSIAFAYAPGATPYDETAPLDVASGDETRAMSASAVASLERQVLEAPLVGIVLRYGKLYGPGTGFDAPAAGGALHTDAAADAARRALTRGSRGIYNIAENDGTLSSAKAERELGWDAGFRAGDGVSA